MGWKCLACGNTEDFIETNRVETLIEQNKDSTEIMKIINKYLDDALIEVRCENAKAAT